MDAVEPITAGDNSPEWSRGRLERVIRCPACGGDTPSHVFERRDNEARLPDRWRMVRCKACGSLWLDPRPDAESLPRAYANYYTHDAEVEDNIAPGVRGIAWRLVNGYLNHRFGMHRIPASVMGRLIFPLFEPWRLKLDYYGRHLTRCKFPTHGRLLDVGCGNGSFLRRARDMGWEVLGCDPDPKAAETCRAQGLDVRAADAFDSAFGASSFDVVMASHVLEHVADQPMLLRRFFSLLRPGAWLWLALPNPESYGLRIFGAAWSELHFPYHLCVPTQPVLAKWLVDVGFEEPHFIRRGAHARRVWRLSQAIAAREHIDVPSKIVLMGLQILADISGTISSRHGEETVVMAQKPGADHAA